MSNEIQQQAEPEFPKLLEKQKPQVALALPPGLEVDRFVRVALTVFRLEPKIQACTPASILGSFMKACEMGLELGGILGHAYLIPYGKECTLQVGYKGFLHLARQTGHFREIDAVLVFEKDKIEVTRDPRPHIYHRPELFTPGPEVGAYAYAITSSSEIAFEWMNRAELDKIASSPKAGPVWKTWYGQMCLKSVIKRFLKTQPLSPTLVKAFEHEESQEVPALASAAVSAEAPGPRPATRSEALAASLMDRGASKGKDVPPDLEPHWEESDDPDDILTTEAGARG